MIFALSQPLLTIRSLDCERGYRQLFRNLNVELSAGEVLRIAGPNGSGKSTLLKIVSGISSDYAGELFWQGQALKSCRDIYHSQMCFLGHAKAVKATLTATENLTSFQGLYPCKASVSINDVLQQVGLAAYAETLCGQLSAGQQQRVALARLLMSAANLWILDEPFTAIDKHGVAEFEHLIGQFVERGGAVMITTHHNLQLPVSVRTLDLGDELAEVTDNA